MKLYHNETCYNTLTDVPAHKKQSLKAICASIQCILALPLENSSSRQAGMFPFHLARLVMHHIGGHNGHNTGNVYSYESLPG